MTAETVIHCNDDLEIIQDKLLQLEKFLNFQIAGRKKTEALLDAAKNNNCQLEKYIDTLKHDNVKLQDTLEVLRKGYTKTSSVEDENLKLKGHVQKLEDEMELVKKSHLQEMQDLYASIRTTEIEYDAKIVKLREEMQQKHEEFMKEHSAFIQEKEVRIEKLEDELNLIKETSESSQLLLKQEYEQKLQKVQNQQRASEMFSSNPTNNIYRQKLEYLQSESQKKISELESKIAALEDDKRSLMQKKRLSTGSTTLATTNVNAPFTPASQIYSSTKYSISGPQQSQSSRNTAPVPSGVNRPSSSDWSFNSRTTTGSISNSPANQMSSNQMSTPNQMQNTQTHRTPTSTNKVMPGKRRLFTLSSVPELGDNFI